MLPNSLLEVIDKALKGGGSGIRMSEIDASKLEEYMAFVDTVVVECLVQPKVSLPPEDATDRTDDVLYTDEIEDNDKFFILQWAMGGTKDLETFRRQQAAAVESVSSGASIELSAERAPGGG
jgi:hypothetical protein